MPLKMAASLQSLPIALILPLTSTDRQTDTLLHPSPAIYHALYPVCVFTGYPHVLSAEFQDEFQKTVSKK